MNRTKKEHDEHLFWQIASRYTEYEGKLLKEEVNNWQDQGLSNSFTNMDREIYSYIRKRKRIKLYRRMCGAAASILLIVGLTFFFRMNGNKNLSGEQSTLDGNLSSSEQENYEVITLSAKLPPGFEIKEVKVDLEETIYFIENDKKDDVVLVISRAKELLHSGLKETILNEESAYGLSRKDYHILTFQRNEFIYTLTCEYDMGTLFEIGGSII